MAKANRKTKVTVAANAAPPVAPVVKSAYTGPALVLGAPAPQAATQAAIAFLQASLGVAPAPQAPVAPALAIAITNATPARAARTAHNWARGAVVGNANVLLPGSANFAPHQVITLLVTGNPKSRNSAVRFGKYVTGQTVAQYIAACAAIPGCNAKLTHADLKWDVNHGFISVA